MTDQQINAAIAEALGWEQKGNTWLTPSGTPVFATDVPNYCNDLNAMHEAEKVLAPKNWNNFKKNWWDYCKLLREGNDASEAIHANARQRAEAFLRTLGKWEEKPL